MNQELYNFLEEKYLYYNRPEFISSDPIQVPHQFENKEDIEISGFLAATIAWGQRKTIISNALRLIKMMDNRPHHFILNASNDDLAEFLQFKHRTFNGIDTVYFLQSLRNIYRNHQGMEHVFLKGYSKNRNIREAIIHFREVFFEIPHPDRTKKHVADPEKNASAKRINMFLRWMVRRDDRGVDFGIWKNMDPSDLNIPLDVHTGNVALKLGLLCRKQHNWQAVEELTDNLRRFDNRDPVKYDFALFGLGAFENF